MLHCFVQWCPVQKTMRIMVGAGAGATNLACSEKCVLYNDPPLNPDEQMEARSRVSKLEAAIQAFGEEDPVGCSWIAGGVAQGLGPSEGPISARSGATHRRRSRHGRGRSWRH